MFIGLVLFGFALIAHQSAAAEVKCDGGATRNDNTTKVWITMENACITEMRRQIQMEVDASITYLQMGAHFSRDTVNRPGFAHMFFEAAGEEREHATKLIDYMLMRGNVALEKLIKVQAKEQTWVDGVDALNSALALEAEVTKSIRKVIVACESDSNDYHLVDYLTGEFLEEQYKGQRDIAGKLATLQKMNNGSPLGEFLFDKTLLA